MPDRDPVRTKKPVVRKTVAGNDAHSVPTLPSLIDKAGDTNKFLLDLYNSVSCLYSKLSRNQITERPDSVLEEKSKEGLLNDLGWKLDIADTLVSDIQQVVKRLHDLM